MKKHTLRHNLAAFLFMCLSSSLVSVNAQEPYEWRGLMIDVSRHFAPIEFLYKQVDWMSQYGLNTLHLHLTDAAGWRVEIQGYPRLTEVAAWRPEADWRQWWRKGDRHYASPGAYGGYYTQEQLRQLVTYAAERGITIVPEIEFPAHSEEVFAAYPELCCTGQPYTAADFCIGNDSTFLFMAEVLRQVASIFPSPYLHVGGDEAGGKLWKECPKCQKTSQAEAMRRINTIVQSLGRKMVAWDECLTDNPADSSMTIMVWRDVEIAEKALQLGHQVVLCPGKYLYLDAYQDDPSSQPEAIGGYNPLQRVYDFHEVISALREKGGGKVLGLQGNLWTEYVPNTAHAESMLWPRALAIAEVGSGKPRRWKKFHKWAVKQVRHMRVNGLNAFDLEHEVGQRPEYAKRAKCLSTGCPVTYNAPFNKSYVAAGEVTLTDGKQGSWTYKDDRWQGFIGRRGMDVTIDLGRTRNIRSIMGSFNQSLNPYIYLPERVTISISNDGNSFNNLMDQGYERQERPVVFQNMGWTGKTKARYVRIQALPGDRGGWIFCDEIMVR